MPSTDTRELVERLAERLWQAWMNGRRQSGNERGADHWSELSEVDKGYWRREVDALLRSPAERGEGAAVIQFAEDWADKWDRVTDASSADSHWQRGWIQGLLYCAENLRSNAETLRAEQDPLASPPAPVEGTPSFSNASDNDNRSPSGEDMTPGLRGEHNSAQNAAPAPVEGEREERRRSTAFYLWNLAQGSRNIAHYLPSALAHLHTFEQLAALPVQGERGLFPLLDDVEEGEDDDGSVRCTCEWADGEFGGVDPSWPSEIRTGCPVHWKAPDPPSAAFYMEFVERFVDAVEVRGFQALMPLVGEYRRRCREVASPAPSNEPCPSCGHVLFHTRECSASPAPSAPEEP